MNAAGRQKADQEGKDLEHALFKRGSDIRFLFSGLSGGIKLDTIY